MRKVTKSLDLIPKMTIIPLVASLSACQMMDTSQAPEQQVEQLAPQAAYAAHWLTSELVLLAPSIATTNLQFKTALLEGHMSQNAALDAVELPAWVTASYPHLADFKAYKVALTNQQAKSWAKGQVSVVDSKGALVSFVQQGELLDSLYTLTANDANEVSDLGATVLADSVQFKLWAPTAQKVTLLAFGNSLHNSASKIAMQEDKNTGVWQVKADNVAALDYYQYEITVYHPETQKVETIVTTDPYALSLSTNSTHAQVVDLNDKVTQPTGWASHSVPSINKPEDNVLYETHIRDFSASDQALSNAAWRGKYLAFTDMNSDGMKHLTALRDAGLNNIHLLPTYDLGSINEDAETVIDHTSSMQFVCKQLPKLDECQSTWEKGTRVVDVLKNYPTDSAKAQKLVSALRQFDNYNWGYDPFHYTVPEGSYATNSMGVTRIVEFREMVQHLHSMGFRVIMDVVYNHTHQYGLAKNSVLDKIVPGYYHRLNPTTGIVEQSTCYTCGNTATERTMMAKLMNDSLVTWARDYKIDGFRFDLMGHQPKAEMLQARELVREVDPDTYFYGEGWNFGEVANNAQFVQASQLELGGTEIGTFSDRLRDAVRGPGNNTRDTQGVGNGLLTLPNELQTDAQSKQRYFVAMDQVRIGMAGNLAEYDLANKYNGLNKRLGKDVPYGDQPTGYAFDPADTINYVSKHDNQTLWDNSQYRLAFDLTTTERVRLHAQSMSYVMYGQGIPFIHMGSELLRSKSFLRDSYDYGDWFNATDFAGQSNNYDVGLPPADKDKDNWPLIKTVLAGHQDRDDVNSADIKLAKGMFIDMLKIRNSSELFRLATADQVQQKVQFLNTQKSVNDKNHQSGLIVMQLDDTQGEAVDNKFSRILVIFNANNEQNSFKVVESQDYQLHPVLKQGHDPVVKETKITAEGIDVPALSTVVLVKYK
ncbi:pullulanase-type alpha-1,6-glucosidase [Pseudoalteromonas phenolica]|uniref:Alpha amylase n=3 Tax=Pseudoalteromonas phenolica TaxID=161398 RepID=A0A0S2K6Q0_9GAMM|nr:pullulanase-type alpha-1,6-glucosidase [Pseudoalteromonas phenolica]ALO44106.1 alpha amylase [Pseudoalteromonas phenolica]MBE0357090.1 hypothetical protein [Pseudoalteromonas phenolica O-BC30]